MTKKKAKETPAPQSGGGTENRFKGSIKRWVGRVKEGSPKALIILIVIALAILVIASQML